jgi:hypothetical protein
MRSLDEIADYYNTDKRYQDHNYVSMYQKFMESNRLSTNRILEIGFGSGASSKMWIEYFPNADVYCMEYFDEEYKNVWNSPSSNIENLNIVRGDSTKTETWNEVPYEFDYLIDDGSHFPKDQINTFLLGFPHVKSNGYYFIEDLHCGLENKYGKTDMIYQWLFDLIIKQQTPNYGLGGNFYNAQSYIEGIAKDIYSYHIYKSVICLEKA